MIFYHSRPQLAQSMLDDGPELLQLAPRKITIDLDAFNNDLLKYLVRIQTRLNGIEAALRQRII